MGRFSQQIEIAGVQTLALRAAGGVSPNMALGQMPTRPALLVRLTDGEGAEGWGEVWANFPPRANAHKAHVIEDVIAPALLGMRFTDPAEIGAALRDRLATYFLHVGQKKVFEHILAGLDIAAWDLALHRAGQSFAGFMSLERPVAQTYASSINPPDLEEMIARHAGWGETRFKLKLGFGDEADLAFVARGAQLVPEGCRFMVDNNQTWDAERAARMLAALEAHEPLFAEEPIPADAGQGVWEALARGTTIPLAGGENLYGLAEFRAAIAAGLRFVQPDIAKWGGVSGALALAAELPEGVALWPHFMGTAVGQQAALCVAARIGADSTCEMDVNANPLRSELCGAVLTVAQGGVRLPEGPGLVAPPLPEQLERFRDAG